MPLRWARMGRTRSCPHQGEEKAQRTNKIMILPHMERLRWKIRVMQTKEKKINLFNTNARSSWPKIQSFVDCMTELESDLAIVMETWLPRGECLEKKTEELLLGNNLKTLARSRAAGLRGVNHGTVAIVVNNTTMKIEKKSFDNPDDLEILAATATLSGLKRKIGIIAAYILPGYAVPRGRACLEKISDLVHDFKNRLDEPLIIVGGDFNQWVLSRELEDFLDLWDLNAGPTRGDRRIDLIFSNLPEERTVAGILPPLETEGEEAVQSDHRVLHIKTDFDRSLKKKVEKYSLSSMYA